MDCLRNFYDTLGLRIQWIKSNATSKANDSYPFDWLVKSGPRFNMSISSSFGGSCFLSKTPEENSRMLVFKEWLKRLIYGSANL